MDLTSAITRALKKDKDKTIQPQPVLDLADGLQTLQPAIKEDDFGPPINESICEALKPSWHKVFRKEEIIDTIVNTKRPENATMLKPLEVDADIPISKEKRRAEQDIRYISNAVCAAGKSLAYLLDMLMTTKQQCLATSRGDLGKLILDAQDEENEDAEFSFDFPGAIELAVNSLKLLGMANVQTGQHRRAKLASKFKPEYQKLCGRGQDFPDGKFFGSNFNAAVALAADKNKGTHQALKDTKPKQQGFKRFKRKNNDNNYLSTAQLQGAVMQQALALSAGQNQQGYGNFQQQQHFLAQSLGGMSLLLTTNQMQYPTFPFIPRGCSRGQGWWQGGRRGGGDKQAYSTSSSFCKK